MPIEPPWQPSNDDRADAFGSVPELPPPSERRWTIRRKAAVIEAVRGGWVPIEEVCRLYTLSVDEFLAWERDVDRFGIHGLRCTRYQIYRDAKPRRRYRRHQAIGRRGAPGGIDIVDDLPGGDGSNGA